MGTVYTLDRAFTDKVHKKLALLKIYRGLGWIEQEINEDVRARVDLNAAVDYVCVEKYGGKTVTIQERFKDVSNKIYNHFTIRFESENGDGGDELKLNADYLVYGTINSSKFEVDKATDFVKYVVVDVKKFMALIESGVIVIEKDRNLGTSRMLGDKIYCPLMHFSDRSSSFVMVDVKMFKRVCPNGIVIQQGML